MSNSRSLKTDVSRYMSYLLRHNSENMEMDRHGFVDVDKLVEKLEERFPIDKKILFEITERSARRRFEIIGNKIRALYGHTIPVELELEENRIVKVLYHGTTSEAAYKIMKEGLKPMKRRWVHLSPTREVAMEVGQRRTNSPVILKIDVEAARKSGLRFYEATDKVYVCDAILPRYIARAVEGNEGMMRHERH